MSDFIPEMRERALSDDARHDEELRKILAPPPPKRQKAKAEPVIPPEDLLPQPEVTAATKPVAKKAAPASSRKKVTKNPFQR